jgi:hypothetical protein
LDPSRLFGDRNPPRVLRSDPEVSVDIHAYGLPRDDATDIPAQLAIISEAMNKSGVAWCMAGKLLINYYYVPQVTYVKVYPVNYYDTEKNLNYL